MGESQAKYQVVFQAKTQVVFQAKTEAKICLLNWAPEMQSVDGPLGARLPHLLEGHVALEAVPHTQHSAAEGAFFLALKRPLENPQTANGVDKKRSEAEALRTSKRSYSVRSSEGFCALASVVRKSLNNRAGQS